MDLGKFLRDRKKDVVNRWQNSTVLDAVSANTQADQARRVAQGQPQQYQGNKFAQGLTNIVGANKMQDTSVQDRQDDQTFKNDLSNIINLRTSGQITPEQARGKALNAAPTGNTDYTKDVLNNQANRSSIGQAVLPALGTFAKPFATGLSDVGTAVGTGVEAFTPFNGVGKNIQDVSKRQSQGIDDLYKASSFNGGQKGENRLVTGLSSGVGSLASSLATGATKGLTTNAGKTLLSPSTMSGLQFGLSAGAGQMRDATANNKSAVRSFGTGLAGGAIEAGLEKVGLDKYLGAGGGFVRKTGTRMLTEGLQEGAQSLGQSLITGSFKRVDPVQALKQAALEGGMGFLVGGIGGVGGDLALNLQQSQSVPQDVKQQVVQSKPVLQQTGIPAQPGSVRERIQIAKENVTNKIASSITPMDQAEAIPNIFQRQQDVTPTVRANQNELGALKSYLDYQYGLTPSGAPTAQELNLLNRDVRTAAQRLGIPLNNGLNNNAEVIREYLDTVGTKNTPKYTTLESQQPKPSLMNKLGIKPMDEVGSVPMDSPLLPLNKLAKNTDKPDYIGKVFKRKDGKTNIQLDGKLQTFDEYTDQLGNKKTRLKDSSGNSTSADGWISDGSWNIKDGGEGQIAWLKKQIIEEKNQGRRQDLARERYNLEQKIQPENGASEGYKSLAKATAIKTEALKKQGKITPKDEGYWSTPIKGQPKTPIPGVKDTNGLTPMEGDKIEFDSILSDNDGKTKKGTATVRWSEPSIANASGKEMPGQWLGNGALDSNLPFTIVERNGKPIAPQVGKTDFNKLSMAELNKVVNDDYKRLDRNTLVTEALEKYPSNPKATKAQGEQIVADRQKYIDGAIKSFNEKYGTDFEDMSDLLIREDYVRDAGRTEISDFRTSTLFGKGTPDKFYTNSKYAKQEMGISTPQTVKITPNNQRTIDSYSTPKPVTEYKVGEKVSNATAQGGTVNGTITKTPDFSKDLRLKGNDFIIKLADGTTVKTSGAGFDAPVPQANKSAKKPFKPLSTPEDNIPAIAKQVTKTQGDKLDAKSYADTFGISQEQAELDYEKIAETANKPATLTEKGKDTNKLFEEMKKAPQLDKARAEAQASGKEMNFFAKKDKNDRSVGIEQFDPNTHTIEAGFVVDKQGRMLGNHIKVDANGIQVNIGGKVVNMDSILGNPLDWGNQNRVSNKAFGKYRLSETMNRNIDHNAPSKEVATKTKNFLWSNKVKAEADMRTELDSEYKALGKRIKNTNKAKPMGVSSQQWKDDIFSVLNGDKTDTQIKESYGDKPAQAILDYKKETRTLYDSLLQRVNVERVKFGQPEIQARKDYITHLQELNGSKNFVAEVYGQMKNSFADEGMGKTRNGVPGEIAGRTENFKPISKYNPFLQRRTGTKSERDPYMAVQEYLQPALYNIHMTESGARARAIESAFRTAEQIRNTEPTQLLGESKKIMDKYKSNSDNAKLITGFQEYANAIAGKTQRFDRQLVDSSDAAAKGLKGWQALQRTGGRATILGNASSILAQPLNQVVGLADAGPINYMKGISAAVAGDPAIEKSAFVRARSTEPTKAIRKTGEKVMDAGSIPLQAVELASVKLMWHTQHQKALSQGYKGQEAIQQADLNTERLAAGRGIADKPELYRSTIANGVLQYTLEVNASNKTFWQDLDNKQKATFLVASTATNTLMGAVTGFQPLPDFLKAIFDTGKDILDGSDSQNIGQELASGAQRVGDQYASMNPLVGAGVNLLPQTTRKAVFGQESTIGRYSGASAPIQVVENAAKTLSDVTKGKYKSARDNALRDLPFGNQVRKTVTGAEMLNRGYAVDSSGKKTFDSPSSPLGKAQALVFGPSATKPAREYYDKSSSKPSNSVATKDAQGNETTSDNFDTISKAAFNSPKGKEFVALKNEDARKEFARQSPDNRAIYNDYKAMQKAFNGGDKLLATGLDENSTKTLQKYDRLTPKAKENIFNSNKNAEYEYELASYNNKKANGEVNLVDEINTQQKLNKLKATKDFDKGYRDMYAGLSKTEAYSLITSDPNGKKIADQLLAIDDALVKAGNKAKFRDKYGNVSFAPKSSSGRKGGRSKSNGTVEANSLRTDTLSKLNSLLAGAQKPVTGFKKVASAQPKLKKITVKK